MEKSIGTYTDIPLFDGIAEDDLRGLLHCLHGHEKQYQKVDYEYNYKWYAHKQSPVDNLAVKLVHIEFCGNNQAFIRVFIVHHKRICPAVGLAEIVVILPEGIVDLSVGSRYNRLRNTIHVDDSAVWSFLFQRIVHCRIR